MPDAYVSMKESGANGNGITSSKHLCAQQVSRHLPGFFLTREGYTFSQVDFEIEPCSSKSRLAYPDGN
jgi:hypothetical protein